MTVKAIALVLLAAIANPFCCCFAAAAPEDGGAKTARHADACCSTNERASQAGNDTETSHSDCRHLQERESIISQAADTVSVSSLLLAVVAPLSYADELGQRGVEQEAFQASRLQACSHFVPTGRMIAQAHCVCLR